MPAFTQVLRQAEAASSQHRRVTVREWVNLQNEVASKINLTAATGIGGAIALGSAILASLCVRQQLLGMEQRTMKQLEQLETKVSTQLKEVRQAPAHYTSSHAALC